MIKKTTVIKRMIRKGAPFVAVGILFSAGLTGLSIAAERYLGIGYDQAYWSLFGIAMLAYVLKIVYDANRFAIEMEQEKLMRDLGKN